MEITIKIDRRSKQAKAFLTYLKTLPFIDIKDRDEKGMGKPTEEKSPYNPEFVKKIRRAEKQVERGEYTVLDTDDVWGSLGL